MRDLVPLLLGLISALGCANARLIASDGPRTLKPDEGILVVHIESNFSLRRLRFGTHYDAARDLAAGTHLRLLVVPAGSYRWTTLEVPFGSYGGFYRFRMKKDTDWTFVVKSGHTNYPGQVMIKGSRRELYSEGYLNAWTENRSAIALEQLSETYPALLAQYPLVNGRTTRDDFLDRLRQLTPAARPNPTEEPAQ